MSDREKYVTHYMNLKVWRTNDDTAHCLPCSHFQTYLQLGMKLKKIHRVLAFTQSLFLKSYIDHVTHLRTLAKNEFERDLFKLFISK
jgi:hypothetical protein